ncbi:MAG: hypothetical protein KU37_03410 [Sulfuricurvum sp. PC08-66]|nr:MAG: hypothetical protein KU37_03410 [Sulfuricurvum sp. PC08-66]
MRKFLLLLALFALSYATPQDVQMMLKKAQNAFSTQETINYEREQEFLAALKEQKQLLAKAQAEIATLKARSVTLNATIDANEKSLAALEEKRALRSGNLGELYGMVRQSAGDMHAQLSQSATSVRDKERLGFLENLAKTTRLPDTATLSRFWYIMLQELDWQGFNGKITLPIIDAQGHPKEEVVQMIGVFTGATREGFAYYDSSARTFVELSQAPSGNAQSILLEGYESDETLLETIIDPTRGQLLQLSTQTPSLGERIDQGATIGYIILGLGVLGLLYALFLAVRLLRLERLNRTQNADAMWTHIERAYEANKAQNLDHVELALQEKLTTFDLAIHKGLPLLKLLAAVAPLLGLLGTVTGMIATFGAITLFGTGDPKLMASGISQALVTTVEGLVVAIPLLFAHTLLAGRAKALMEGLNANALGLLAQHKKG